MISEIARRDPATSPGFLNNEMLTCFSAPEIGRSLHISPKTVDTYKQRIHEKLGLAHRSEYVHMAVKLGIMDS